MFFVLAFFLSAFIFWRKGREEHYSETQLFDGFLLAALFGFIVARVGYVTLNFPQFGWNIIKWLDVFAFPGGHLVLGLLGSTLYIARFAQTKKWDVFEILDFWVLATAISSALRYLGYFFDGTVFGNTTSLPWGMIFPGVFENGILFSSIMQSFILFCLFFFLELNIDIEPTSGIELEKNGTNWFFSKCVCNWCFFFLVFYEFLSSFRIYLGRNYLGSIPVFSRSCFWRDFACTTIGKRVFPK